MDPEIDAREQDDNQPMVLLIVCVCVFTVIVLCGAFGTHCYCKRRQNKKVRASSFLGPSSLFSPSPHFHIQIRFFWIIFLPFFPCELWCSFVHKSDLFSFLLLPNDIIRSPTDTRLIRLETLNRVTVIGSHLIRMRIMPFFWHVLMRSTLHNRSLSCPK